MQTSAAVPSIPPSPSLRPVRLFRALWVGLLLGGVVGGYGMAAADAHAAHRAGGHCWRGGP